MKSRKEKKDKSYFLGLILLLLSGFFVLLYFAPEEKPKAKDSADQQRELETKVNRHLFSTSQQIELQRKKMEVAVSDLADKKVSPSKGTEEPPSDIDFTPDPRAIALLKNLRRDTSSPSGPENSDDLIQAELFELEQLEHYSEEYKKEYARQFVENARKAGYNVKLNAEYKIISVAPIRKPAQNFNLFQSEGGAAQ
ncbi:MAG: hypothetical protein IPM97_04370 [Bdellovibrionaceae bacterium]|nr:hypothetical protein [Pseudobdellovibrionaceae bacterium]